MSVPRGHEINEKRWQGECNGELSRVLHASFGLDHYPHYLHRWAREEIDALERTLEAQLENVRAQKRQNEARAAMAAPFALHMRTAAPELGECVRVRDVLHPELLAILHERTHEHVLSPAFCAPHVDAAGGTCEGDVASGGATEGRGGDGDGQQGEAFDYEDDAAFDQRAFQEYVEEEAKGVHSFPLLSDHFCDRVARVVSQFRLFRVQYEAQHDLVKGNARVSPLLLMGLGWLQRFLLFIANNASLHLFPREHAYQLDASAPPSLSSPCLDWVNAYVVHYSPSPSQDGSVRQGLIRHTDDSEVTLNVNLGEGNFKGGVLRLYGERAEASAQPVCEFKPTKGRAVTHIGRHLHEVSPVEAGERISIIVWCRSNAMLRSALCPCCWINQRHAPAPSPSPSASSARPSAPVHSDCICGPQWN